MKLKIRVSDNDILEVESHPSHVLTAGAGESLVDYNGPIKPVAGMKLDAGVPRLKRPDEIPARSKTAKEIRLEEIKNKQNITVADLKEILEIYGLV